MHHSSFFNISLIHFIKSILNRYFSRADTKNKRLTESKDFSMSTVGKIRSICSKSVIPTLSEIKLPSSLRNLYSNMQFDFH